MISILTAAPEARLKPIAGNVCRQSSGRAALLVELLKQTRHC